MMEFLGLARVKLNLQYKGIRKIAVKSLVYADDF